MEIEATQSLSYITMRWYAMENDGQICRKVHYQGCASNFQCQNDLAHIKWGIPLWWQIWERFDICERNFGYINIIATVQIK